MGCKDVGLGDSSSGFSDRLGNTVVNTWVQRTVGYFEILHSYNITLVYCMSVFHGIVAAEVLL